MPFTLSHPAAVIPLRKVLPLTALVAGSIAPDMGYFFSFCRFFSQDSHTFERSFTFCVPIGLFLYGLFCWLEEEILFFFPRSFSEINKKFSQNRPSIVLIPVGVLLGAWTHIFWDSFTHANGFFVKQLPILKWEIFYEFPVFRAAQHVSTLLGGILIFAFIQRTSPLRWRASRLWLFWGFAICSGLAFSWITLTAPWNYALANNDRRLDFLFIVSFMRNIALILVISAIGLKGFKLFCGLRQRL